MYWIKTPKTKMPSLFLQKGKKITKNNLVDPIFLKIKGKKFLPKSFSD